MTPLFRSKAVYIMGRLLKDFPIGVLDASAITGNLGHECNGFKTMQEIAPTSGRGGLGFAQWTGPRRIAFEAWCKAHNLATSSDEANYGYLCMELKGPEASAIPATKMASTLVLKVEAFEMNFERAGVKNYPSRLQYATDAMQAWTEHQVIPATQKPAQPISMPPLAPLPPRPPVAPPLPLKPPAHQQLGIGAVVLLVLAGVWSQVGWAAHVWLWLLGGAIVLGVLAMFFWNRAHTKGN